MFKLKLPDGHEVDVHTYRDFLLLRFSDPGDMDVAQFGRQLFQLELDGVLEVIPTETEILLKVDQKFDENQLAQLKIDAIESDRDIEVHLLPVLFSQFDDHWTRIEEHSGFTRDQYIEELLGCEFSVAMPGFLPGFVYLNGLPNRLQVPRRSTPANRTAPGSIAIGGKYAGVYSLASPAGWNVVGRTSKKLFQLDQLPPLTVEIGDLVRLQRVEEFSCRTLLDEQLKFEGASYSERDFGNGQLTVVSPGMHTLIQDRGRPGLAYFAIPQGGAMDAESAGLANVLLGNPEDVAVIECHFVAPTLRFDSEATICLTGADMQWNVDGTGVDQNRSVRVARGSVLSGGKANKGCRGYIGIHGSIESQRTFGSMSVYPLGAFGANQGRPLQAGDAVPWRTSTKQSPNISFESWSPDGTEECLRMDRGPEFAWLDDKSQRKLLDATFSITGNSDRMGARLKGPGLSSQRTLEHSVPLLPGMIQLTSGGQCIVVLNDGQTTGGYPRIGYLSCPELTRFVQFGPGQCFRFYVNDSFADSGAQD